MRFNIKDYEKAFPRKPEPVKVKVMPAEEDIDSVIEGSSEDSNTPPEPEQDIKIYKGPEPAAQEQATGGDPQGGDE